MTVTDCSLSRLVPDPAQPRRSIPPADLARLVDSIRARGLLLSLRVKPANAAGEHLIISGHRRHAALLKLGATDAPCVVADGPLDAADILAEQLTENLLREDVSPLDEADGYRRYIDARGGTAAQAAKDLHVPPARVAKALTLLALPEPVRDAVHAGRVPKETAYYLTRLPAGPDRDRLVDQALAGDLSRDQAARAAKTARGPASEPGVKRVTCRLPGGRALTVAGPAVRLDGLIEALEDVLREARKARAQGLDVGTLAKVLADRAGNGGVA